LAPRGFASRTAPPAAFGRASFARGFAPSPKGRLSGAWVTTVLAADAEDFEFKALLWLR